MSVLVTGVAGFIGMHVARALLEHEQHVVGVDSINDYYDPTLKYARLKQLTKYKNFKFEKLDFSNLETSRTLLELYPDIDRVLHLGAQAGVRNSIDRPSDYLGSNLAGQLTILELCRSLVTRASNRFNLVYASSSSVYGSNTKVPFSVQHSTDHPISFYGATKKAAEVMAHSYSHLYNIPTIGLRFFTVYGPWGRPDMSPYIFTKNILNGEKIHVFNDGNMKRDFTFIDDIVSGIVAALDNPPQNAKGNAPHKIYNIGNNKPIPLMDYINVIEKACGKTALVELQPMQAGDVQETYADISQSIDDLGYIPKTPIEIGIPRFVDWYRDYHDQNI
ncbi:MAG: protein CapI [Rhodospirillaceae bacterium]|nr:protein CapI [Rhodospirillaceae bacterium]|tara:strand:+ start:2091 stop:3089 length:999 start_codon:yes stop_codon:yes gene_type:complete